MKQKINDGLDFPSSEPASLIRLRQLVSAMTMPEKNAFKHYIRSYKDGNHDSSYIRLYDCVNDCLTEDERKSRKMEQVPLPQEKAETFYEKFKSRNAKRKICKPAELGKKANYLFYRLLESQRGMNFDQRKRRQLYIAMLDVHFLFSKAMWEECLRKVHQALTIATELEALSQLLELLHYERELLAKLGGDDLEKKLREVYEKEERYLLQFRLSTFFNDLRTEVVLLLWRRGNVEEKDVLRRKINLFIEYAGEGKSFDDTFDLNLYYHSIMAGLVLIDLHTPTRFLEFLSHKGYETVTLHYKMIVNLYQRFPERKRENFVRYLGDLSNYLSYAYNTKGEKVNLEDYKDDLEKIKPNDPNFLTFVVYFTLIDCVRARDFTKAEVFLEDKQVWERIKTLGEKIPVSRLQVIRQLAGTIFFVREKFKEADLWFKANLDDERNIKNKEVMIASELYHLLIKFEQGGTASIGKKKVYLESLQRRLGDLAALENFEGILLKALEEILKAGRQDEKLKPVCAVYLPLLKKELEKKNGTSHFHLFIGWLESKSTGKGLRVAVEPYL
ncbi:MAG: hypothetical protein OHK0019_01100 [Saprospiraceae bacterium]